MKCPFCSELDSRVIDTRPSDDGFKIRRRRQCESCQMRFTTYETVDHATVWVLKRDGSREEFDSNKVLNSMVRACKKQTFDISEFKKIVGSIEAKIYSSPEHEITSVEIGEYIISKLRNIDEAAYIRFASVYRDFTDIESFAKEIKRMERDKEK